MKVGLVLFRFDPSRGGTEVYAHRLSRHLANLGHEPHIFAHSVKGDAPWAIRHKVPMLVNVRTFRDWIFARSAHRLMMRKDIDVSLSFGRTYAADVYMPTSGVHRASRDRELRSIPSRSHRMAKEILRRVSLRQHLILDMERAQLQPSAGCIIVAISPMVREDITRWYTPGPERVVVIRNGVDLARFHPRLKDTLRGPVRAGYGLSEDMLVLLFVAHNFQLKGLHILVKAIGRLRRDHPDQKIKALIVGRGNPGPYRRLARKEGCLDSLVFTGSTEQVEQYYAAADVFVLPTFNDTCSLVCLEAMASGLPLISSYYSGVSDLLTEGVNGFRVPPDDIQAISKAIEALFDPQRRTLASRTARRVAEEYPIENQLQEVVETLCEVAKARHGRL